MPRPFVSVLIDTYNHERFIEQAIVSVLEQDFPAAEREIIVVDDGSVDGAGQIAAEYGARLIRTENRGLSAARNLGWQSATGEIVAYIDDDARLFFNFPHGGLRQGLTWLKLTAWY